MEMTERSFRGSSLQDFKFEDEIGHGGIEDEIGHGGIEDEIGRGGIEDEIGRGGIEDEIGRGGIDDEIGRGGIAEVFKGKCLQDDHIGEYIAIERVPVHIISTNPEYSFNVSQRSTSTSYLSARSTNTTISYKSITDIIPNVRDLKVINKWIIAEYTDGLQMWLSRGNDDVFFKYANTQIFLSFRNNPEFKTRFERDSRQILLCAINQTEK